MDNDVALTDIRLSGATLKNAELQNAKLGRSHFEIDCVNPVLREGHVAWVETTEAEMDLKDLSRKDKDCLSEPTDLMGANLSGSNLVKSQLTGATLVDSNFTNTCLYDADLRGTDLTKANFEDARLRSAQLQGSLLWKTKFKGAHLGNANLSGSVCGVEDKDKNPKYRFHLCSMDELKEMIKHAYEKCAIANSAGEWLGENCSDKDFSEPNCTEDHGFK